MSFSGKVCLVTGASRGIGRDTAIEIAASGATVVVSSRDAGACESVVDEIVAAGGSASARAADVTDAGEMAELVADVERDYGRLDLAFNNAGRILAAGPIHEADPAEFDAAMRLNAGGVFNALRTQIPAMLRAGGGAIVVNSALSGVRGIATIGVYSAAKAAAITLAQVAAQEVGQSGIRINVVAPGYIATDAWMDKLGARADALAQTLPLRRIGVGSDVAKTVAWLLSDEAGYLTGAVVPVDGGLAMV